MVEEDVQVVDERIRNLEITVAIIKHELASLTKAVEENTTAQKQVAEAMATIKGGKAVLVSIVITVFSLITLAVSWIKGN